MTRVLLAGLLLALAACGVKGDPEPPEGAVTPYPSIVGDIP